MVIGYFADGPWSHRALDKLLENASVRVAFICARYDIQDTVLRKKASLSGIPFIVHPIDAVVDTVFNATVRRFLGYPKLESCNVVPKTVSSQLKDRDD